MTIFHGSILDIVHGRDLSQAAFRHSLWGSFTGPFLTVRDRDLSQAVYGYT